MKKKLLIFITLCIFTSQSWGQSFPYASAWSPYSLLYKLSSGFTTTTTTGYFWLGYNSSVINVAGAGHADKNFCILGMGNSAIWADYKVYDAANCNGPLSQVLNGNGVSAIETGGQNGLRYALAGSYDKACYFATLDFAGNVLSAVSYPFPSGPSGQYPDPSQPVIVESVRGNEYYICGSFESDMYVIKVDVTGTVLWSSYYKFNQGLYPKDIIVNPYNPEHIIIVGKAVFDRFDTKGFFMDLDGGNGNITFTKTFGDMAKRYVFNTITLGSNINAGNGAGFVIGGYIQPLLINRGATAWVIKLDPSGNTIWSKQPKPTMGANKGVIDIIERLNTFGNYEYFALLNSNIGMQVLKLDDSGDPFPITSSNFSSNSSSNSFANEFVYDLPSSIPSDATSISYVNGPSNSPDLGIQVFGTSHHFPGFTSSYVVSAYFNGETACYRTLGVQDDPQRGPEEDIPVPVNKYGFLGACSNFTITSFYPYGSINYPCMGYVSAGSNARSSIEGIAENSTHAGNQVNFEVYPNPVSDKATVTYSSPDNGVVKIEVYNLLGQLITSIEPPAKDAGVYNEKINFTSLNVESGVYYVATTVNGEVHKQKIVYNK